LNGLAMQRDRNNEVDPNAPVTEQASCWWVLLNETEASASERRAFAEWVVRSPERVEAFLQAARLSQALRSNTTRWPDTPVEELIRAAQAAPSDIASFPANAHREPATHSATRPASIRARPPTARPDSRLDSVVFSPCGADHDTP